MSVRGRLFAFSAVQLVGFGLLLGVGYYELETTILPMLYEHLGESTETVASTMATQVDVALGGDDPLLVDKAIEGIIHDPALAYVEVRTQAGATFYMHGTASDDVFAGPPNVAVFSDNRVHVWTEIRLEGLLLGKLAVAFDGTPIHRVDVWVTTLAIVATLLWLVALVYSIRFAKHFTRPIHAMKEFSRRVAGGDFSGRLDLEAPGELAELRDYLNQMTRELESREHERAEAAARSETMQRELLTVSRMAGMAEVATGVLHNVGNVLNSLNVSVSVVGDQLRDSKVASLSRTVELYANHPGGFSAFMSTDKGKLLPQFLSTVSARLVEENTQARNELAGVIKNVEHIKTIVATQQRYASTFGVEESVDLAAVVGDALKMGEASFVRHGITVVHDLGELPELVVDRHKLLQILINLVSNARHALKAAEQEPRQLSVRARCSDTSVTLTVADTGVGISAENLAKIFQHGFTTKQGGHGFGLHASANAARELGGSLTAASDGVGRGATFTLELPIKRTRTHDRN